jgi:UDP:flavonoid glycosyltransferase YjiC (YdhE family)
MMARWGARLIPRQYDLLTELVSGPECVLVANPGVLAARIVQEKLKCPMATLLLQPGLIPSTSAPPQMPGGLTLPARMPRWVGGLYWAAVDAAGYLIVGRSLNRVRASLGLAPVWRLFQWWWSPDLVIGLFPDWYAGLQPDWPTQLRLAGFGNFDGGSGGGLSDDIREFCMASDPPIAFTLGTGMAHGAGFFRTVVAAYEKVGMRGLLLTKFPHLIPPRLPPGVRHCTFAAFRKLLPYCAALVHHGGIGTTAAALATGTPQLILPLAWDQPDNAGRVRRLGVGDWLGPRNRTAGHLARALTKLTAPEVKARCRALADRSSAIDGLEIAARYVEQLARIER